MKYIPLDWEEERGRGSWANEKASSYCSSTSFSRLNTLRMGLKSKREVGKNFSCQALFLSYGFLRWYSMYFFLNLQVITTLMLSGIFKSFYTPQDPAKLYCKLLGFRGLNRSDRFSSLSLWVLHTIARWLFISESDLVRLLNLGNRSLQK